MKNSRRRDLTRSGNSVALRWVLALSSLLPIATHGLAQTPPDPDYVRQQIFPSYDAFRAEVDRIVMLSDANERHTQLDAFWQQLKSAGQVPYAQGNQVAYLYRGGGTNATIAWPGDANGWNPNANGWQGTRMGETDLYMLEKSLPSDARLDYKIVRNGSWILDPHNPLQMWGGFGPNSELRMPAYEFPRETVFREAIARGRLGDDVRIGSTRLGYDLQYRVYTPAGYDDGLLANLPTVYVTDGHEYAVDYLGAMVNVMDNLIADGTLRPLVAIFVDPRNPDQLGQNRRATEYVTNENFAGFVKDELVSAIDHAFRTDATATARTILGTSLGGLNSAYFGAVASDTFGNLGIQSPAFWADPAIYDLYRDEQLADGLKIYMTTGNIRDNGGATTMQAILAQYGFDYEFATVNESHSWGAWRGQLDDILTHLVGHPVPEPASSSLLLWWGVTGGFCLRAAHRGLTPRPTP